MWTYSGDPTASPKDEVRFLIGDTNPEEQQLQDAEINYLIIETYGSLANAPPTGNFLPAAHAADNIAAGYARLADSKGVGDLSISWSNRFQQFKAIAARLHARATNALIPMYAGGEIWSEKRATYSNPDIVTTAAKIDGMNYVATPNKINVAEDDPSIGP